MRNISVKLFEYKKFSECGFKDVSILSAGGHHFE